MCHRGSTLLVQNANCSQMATAGRHSQFVEGLQRLQTWYAGRLNDKDLSDVCAVYAQCFTLGSLLEIFQYFSCYNAIVPILEFFQF